MNTGTKLLTWALSGTLLASAASAEQVHLGARATNELGLDLYRLFAAKDGNLCLSPYSIQTAFAMTTNGAAGQTLEEMRAVLHYPQDLSNLNNAFDGLAAEFAQRQENAVKNAERFSKGKDPQPTFQLMVANRLFGQKGYPFEPAFLKVVEKSYHAPLQFADFEGNFAGERKVINKWVEDQTRERIVDLLPDGALDSETRLVLVNALYFKAAWRNKFRTSATKPADFHLQSDNLVEVPTMHATQRYGYSKEEGYTAVTLPYSEGFVMLLVVPDDPDGLAAIGKELSAEKLSGLARLKTRMVDLSLPKFKIEGATISLKDSLLQLGMTRAFDAKHAEFEPMIADKTLPGLFISNAFHKTFIAVDEKGTEAAAATAVVMARMSAAPRPEEPVAVRVDRPFLYAIMDTGSRTALFLGRVEDPR